MSKIKLLNGIIGIFLVTILFSCASSSNVAPEWVTNPESAYNSNEYLWAVGSGADRKNAENDALALLVRSIQQNVVTTTEANQRFAGNEEAGYDMNYDYSSSVLTASSIQEIPGITFPQTWIAGNGTVYTLALLNRQETGRYYRQKIADLTAVVESEIVYATANKGTFATLRALQNAVESAWENQQYIDTLAGINSNMYRMVSLEYGSAQAVEVLATRQKENIVVTVKVDGDSNGRIAAVLESTLADLGLKITSPSESTATYIFQGKVMMEPLKLDNKYEYARFVIDIDLIEASSGKILFPYTENGREAHVSYGEATQRAFRTMEDMLEKEFVPQFLEFLKTTTD